MEPTPLPARRTFRVGWWLLGISAAVVMLAAIVVALVLAPHFRMARDVERLGGSVKWHKPIGGLEEIELTRGGGRGEWVKQQDWRQFDSLRRLILKRGNLSDSGLVPLKRLRNLNSLDLEGNPQLTPEGLSELKAIRSLQRLDVDAFILMHDDAVEHLSQLSQLKELNFFGRQIEADQLDELRKAMPGTKIDVLDPTATGMAMRPVYLRAVVRVTYHPNGKWLASGDGYGRLKLWDVDERRVLWSEQAHSDWLFGLGFDPTGRVLATSGGDNAIRLWDVNRRRLITTLDGHNDDVHSVAFTPDGSTLLSTGDDMTVRHWKIGDTQNLLENSDSRMEWESDIWEGHEDTIPALALSKDSYWAASGSRDGTVRLWNLRTQRPTYTFKHSVHKRPLDEHGVSAAAFDPQVPRGDVLGVAFHPQGQQLASIGYDGQVRVWDIATGERLAEWPAHNGWAFGLDFSPGGHLIATCGRRGVIVLWNEAGERQQEFQADDDVACVTFSPDGRRLAACTANGQIQIWTLADSSSPTDAKPTSKLHGTAVSLRE